MDEAIYISDAERLQALQEELNSYQICVESSLQSISKLNIQYEKTVNELSTIINIFEYINMVTDYKNLFPIINDMLIGVLGATNSTIFTYSNGNLKVETSNISRQMLKGIDGIAESLLTRQALLEETSILGQEEIQDEYSLSRNITSAMVVPLKNKEKFVGVIYLEHEKEDYFNKEDIRYINTLAIAIRLSLENAQLYSKLEEMALRDGLTGLYNRMFFNKEINNCMENYKKYDLPFVLALFDVDLFKQVNDTYGHICGDKVLKELSELVKMEIRKDDILCRYGGEEFAIIFRNTNDLKNILSRLEEIREKVQNSYVEFEDKEVRITISFGVVNCQCLDKSGTAEQLIGCADIALYEAKRLGRNRVCIYKG